MNRFDLMFDDAEEYLAKKKKELDDLEKRAKEERIRIESNGVCQGCFNDKLPLRWVHGNEFYLCYECFIHDLQCQADVMVPSYRVIDMDGFVEYYEWELLWENNE